MNNFGVTQPDYQRLLKTTFDSFKYIKLMEYIKRNAAILLHQVNYCFEQKFIKKSADFDND